MVAEVLKELCHKSGTSMAVPPGDRVDWPPEMVDKPVLVAGGLRLYEF
jgi:cytochrome c5